MERIILPTKVWHLVLARLDLPKVGVHVLRHSAAARIVGAGGSAKTLQTVLGHRSAAFSLTV
jgi:integrase